MSKVPTFPEILSPMLSLGGLPPFSETFFYEEYFVKYWGLELKNRPIYVLVNLKSTAWF